jgi:hypothetical protein
VRCYFLLKHLKFDAFAVSVFQENRQFRERFETPSSAHDGILNLFLVSWQRVIVAEDADSNALAMAG